MNILGDLKTIDTKYLKMSNAIPSNHDFKVSPRAFHHGHHVKRKNVSPTPTEPLTPDMTLNFERMPSIKVKLPKMSLSSRTKSKNLHQNFKDYMPE